MNIIVKDNKPETHMCITTCSMVEYEPEYDRLCVRQFNLNGGMGSIMYINQARVEGRENESGPEAAEQIINGMNSRNYCKIVCESFKVYS